MPTRDDPNAPGPAANPTTRRDDKAPVVTPTPENVPQQRPEDMRPDLTIRKGPATMAAERPRSNR